ncbi:hypothetical protein B0A48_10782 [Cryoendolithus antarcticus]|uniref:Fungal N-terminal domain-containing protein n=1 Tax=Cryoendolithus antarcticus TaxID=1507870 RepID=A0A1V8SZ50_9PEZI|nr:hypothetical protein B0A48_10782 [Cryoendolithus antarcticus]
MPEPLSIATGVLTVLGVCTKVGWQLNQFQGAAKVVDTTVEALKADIDGIVKVLQALEETIRLTRASAFEETGHIGTHWRNLSTSIADGKDVLDNLLSLLERVAKKTTLLNRPRMQLRYQLAEDQLDMLQKRLRSWRDTIQLSLCIVILWRQGEASELQSSAVLSLKVFDTSIRKLAETFNAQIQSLQCVARGEEEELDLRMATNLRECVRSAASVVSSASTALGVTEEDRDSIIAPSDFGDCLPNGSRLDIQQWIDSRTEYEYSVREDQDVEDQNTVFRESDGSDTEVEDAAELDMDMVRILLSRGQKAYAEGRSNVALRSLDNCFSRADTISQSSSKRYLKHVDETKALRKSALHLLTKIHVDQSRWGDARLCLEKRLHIHDTKAFMHVADDLEVLVAVLLKLEDYNEAHRCARRLLLIYRNKVSGYPSCIVDTLRLLVAVSQKMQDAHQEEGYLAMLLHMGESMDEDETALHNNGIALSPVSIRPTSSWRQTPPVEEDASIAGACINESPDSYPREKADLPSISMQVLEKATDDTVVAYEEPFNRTVSRGRSHRRARVITTARSESPEIVRPSLFYDYHSDVIPNVVEESELCQVTASHLDCLEDASDTLAEGPSSLCELDSAGSQRPCPKITDRQDPADAPLTEDRESLRDEVAPNLSTMILQAPTDLASEPTVPPEPLQLWMKYNTTVESDDAGSVHSEDSFESAYSIAGSSQIAQGSDQTATMATIWTDLETSGRSNRQLGDLQTSPVTVKDDSADHSTDQPSSGIEVDSQEIVDSERSARRPSIVHGQVRQSQPRFARLSRLFSGRPIHHRPSIGARGDSATLQAQSAETMYAEDSANVGSRTRASSMIPPAAVVLPDGVDNLLPRPKSAPGIFDDSVPPKNLDFPWRAVPFEGSLRKDQSGVPVQVDHSRLPAIARNVCCIGDGNCGKTGFLHRASTNNPPEINAPTVVAETYMVRVEVNTPSRAWVDLNIRDTSGEDGRLDRLSTELESCHVVLIAFDLSLQDSLINVQAKWIHGVRLLAPNKPIILVGCRRDLWQEACRKNAEGTSSERPTLPGLHTCHSTKATLQEKSAVMNGRMVSKDIGAAEYFETSAFDGYGVDTVLRRAASLALAQSQTTQQSGRRARHIRVSSLWTTQKPAIGQEYAPRVGIT